MKKLYLKGTKNVMLEDEREIELSYYLTEYVKKGNEDSNLYGIQIEKRDKDDTQIEDSGCISYSKEVVQQMIYKLMEYSVTPITMLYIIDEFVTEKLCS